MTANIDAKMDDTRFQTNNSLTQKAQPRQQLSKAMEHMRFAVTVDPIPHSSSPTPPTATTTTTTSPPTEATTTETKPQENTKPSESDAYGVPASFAPVRAPAARSHSPSNNQKRTDPFAFGSRFLEEGDDIFEFNAWDHVTVDDTYKEFSAQQYERQRQEPVSDFDKARFNAQPEKWWNLFYKNNKTNFFKNRKWLAQEFPILDEVTKEDSPPAVLLEVGAGAGNSAFPILSKNKNPGLKIHACDFSKKAVELIRSHELYNTENIQADVWDVASSPDSENGGLPAGLAEGSVDVVLMIFIFSALNPTQWNQAVRNIWRVLKPGGQVLFRDYGRGDLAQVRFKKGRWMDDNFYVRGDGTRVYFFEKEELEEIWGGPSAVSQSQSQGASDDALSNHTKSNLTLESLPDREPLPTPAEVPVEEALSPQSSNIATPRPSSPSSAPETQNSDSQHQTPRERDPVPTPEFDVVHFGVDRRMLVNRQRRLKMYRCWMQAVFKKPGEESEVKTSTIRQDKQDGQDREVVEPGEMAPRQDKDGQAKTEVGTQS